MNLMKRLNSINPGDTGLTKEEFFLKWENPPLSEGEQLKLIRKNPYYIEYLRDPTERVQLEAIQKTRFAIMLMAEPCEAAQLLCAHYYPEAIDLIADPTPNVQWDVVSKNPHLIRKIKYPTEKVLKYADEKGFPHYLLNKEEQMNVLDIPGWGIQSIREPHWEVVWKAIWKYPADLGIVRYPWEELILMAVKRVKDDTNGECSILGIINNPTKKMLKLIREEY